MFKKIAKIVFILLLIPVCLMSIGLILVFAMDDGNKKPGTYQYGVVFGAALRGKGKLSATLESRMKIALGLYRDGSVEKLILSGANDPSEPMAMFNYALKQNISHKDMILDEEGENTIRTLLYVKEKISPEKRVLFISSSFHLARIRISAFLLGIKNADFYPSETQHPQVMSFVFRESLAIWHNIVKALVLRIF